MKHKDHYLVRFIEGEDRAFDFLRKLLKTDIALKECSVTGEDVEDIFLKVGAKDVS